MLMIYAKPAEKLQVLSREDRMQIFSNLEELLGCNKALLDGLSVEEEGCSLPTLTTAFIQVTTMRCQRRRVRATSHPQVTSPSATRPNLCPVPVRR